MSDRCDGLTRDVGDCFLIQLIQVSEQPVVTCPIDRPEPGHEQLIGEIRADQPKLLSAFDRRTYADHHVLCQGVGELCQRLTLQGLRCQAFGGAHWSEEPGMLLCMQQRLIVYVINGGPEGLGGERGERFAGRGKLQAIETIADHCAEEIGFILKVVIRRTLPDLRFLKNAIERSRLEAVCGELLCRDGQQPLTFFTRHPRKTGKRHPMLLCQ